ncbi:hypothetical protein AYY22_07825 [Photobacterium kishitanii]|nr:hypothetical protein [Photobacterium kishitanii]OBU22866.1 hypothetical protein AYY22_07825 [Photobacterium kishitanii]
MLYLSSGELIDIIISETYWKYFAPYFKASKSIITTKLQEIGSIRNSLAHFRPLKEDDIELIKQNTKHILLEIEKCLSEITSVSNIVPSNTDKEWYSVITNLGSDNVKLSLFSSNNEKWVKLVLKYEIPTFMVRHQSDTYLALSVGSLRVSEIIKNYQGLKNSCIYITEGNLNGRILADKSLKATQTLNFTFFEKNLSDDTIQIASALCELISSIDEETDYLKGNSLARGKFIESKSISAFTRDSTIRNKSYWVINWNNIDTEIQDVEFWGKETRFDKDFISGSTHYPWMPESISDDDSIPF